METKRPLTEILFANIHETFSAVTDEQMVSIVSGFSLWKHFYHILHSLDRWFINPERYHEPEFHESGMNVPRCKSRANPSGRANVRYA